MDSGASTGSSHWLREHRTDVLVDATHPFAAQMSRHAAAAAGRLGLPLLALRRPAWTEGPGDRWHRVPDAAAAAALLPGLAQRVFLATGQRRPARLRPAGPVVPAARGRPAAAPAGRRGARSCWTGDRSPCDAERALMARHRIEVVVARDSGGAAAAAKLDAARELGLPVVLLDRPPPPPGVPTVDSVPAALAWLERLTSARTPRGRRAGGPGGGR